jgi:hypothetical protein
MGFTMDDPYDMIRMTGAGARFKYCKFVEHPIKLGRVGGRKRNTMHYEVLTHNLKSEK